MKYLLTFLFLFSVINLNSQTFKSIHQLEAEKYAKLGFKTDKEWDEYNNFKKIKVPPSPKGCQMNKMRL